MLSTDMHWLWCCMRLGLAGGALAGLLFLGGCAAPIVLRVPHAVPGKDCAALIPDRDVVVGVAMSGGGSRAALFAAAGLEALGRLQTGRGESFLEQVSYISSVSGGSMASSYYVLNKPGRNVRVLNDNGTMTDAYRAFFDQYRNALSQSFGIDLFWRQIFSFRWFNSSLAAVSLVEILRERLLGNAIWNDVSLREANGDSPGLFINATLYNNGRRLTFTGQPSSVFRYDFIDKLRYSMAERGEPEPIPPPLEQRWKHLTPMTLRDLDSDPCAVTVAGAVASSASFPPIIGPSTFQVEGEETYWHVGDGGLYENQGVESLAFFFLHQLQEYKTRRALIIAFDSSFPFSVGEVRLNRRAQPFSLFSFDFSRVPSIMEERATTYQALFFRTLQLEGVFPDAHTFQIIPLRHIDAPWRDDLSDLPPACRNENLPTPAAVRQRLAEIPTRLRVVSECDRQLLAAAAAKLVAQHQQEILDFIGRTPSVPDH